MTPPYLSFSLPSFCSLFDQWGEKFFCYCYSQTEEVIHIARTTGVDWPMIKNEYISTQISTRALAAKYGVCYSSVNDRCRAEGWVEQRNAQQCRIGALTTQKTAETISDSHAERMTQLMQAGTTAARLLCQHLERMQDSGDVSPTQIRTVTEALKNVRDLYKSVEDETADTSVVVVMDKALEELIG